jgi:serine protease
MRRGFFDQTIASAISDARTLGRGGKGCPVVFASGNSNGAWSGVTFPANLPGVITVGAINSSGNIWGYSSRGAEMDLVCPSGNTGLNGDLVTIDRMGFLGYETGNYTQRFGGTSAACPQVSGVIALMLSVKPDLTESQVAAILQQSATDMGSSGFDTTYGYGRLNAFKALKLVVGEISGAYKLCNSEIYSIPNLPSGATVSWSANPYNLVDLIPNGNSVQVVKQASGKVTLTATITTTCGSATISKEISVGVSQIVGINIKNGANDNQIFCTSHTGNQFEIISDDPTLSHTYEVRVLSYPNLNVVHTQTVSSGGYHGMYYSAIPCYLVLEVREIEPCGPGEWIGFDVEYVNCAEPGGEHLYSVSPNPASSVLIVSADGESINTGAIDSKNKITQPFDVKIYNEKAKVVRQKGSTNGADISFDIEDIPNGTYFLHIFRGKSVIKKQIIIKH